MAKRKKLKIIYRPKSLYRVDYDEIDYEILSLFKEQFISRKPFIIKWNGFEDFVAQLQERGIQEQYNAIVFRINELVKDGKLLKEIKKLNNGLQPVYYLFVKESKAKAPSYTKKLSNRCRKCGNVVFSDSVLCPDCS